MGMPGIIAVLVILAESLGALGVAAVMSGAIAIVHWQNGFFMNWAGKQAGEGFKYHLMALRIAIVLLIRGGGAMSIDGLIAGKN